MYECINDYGRRCNRRPINCYPDHSSDLCLPTFNPCCDDCFPINRHCGRYTPHIDMGFRGGCDLPIPRSNLIFPMCGWICFCLDNDDC